jgi:predicted PurR-regulated permease PerM
MSTGPIIPFYTKFAQISVSVISVFFVLYIGQEIILPLIYATIIAILLNPLVNLLVRHKINRIVAIAITVLAAAIVTGGLLYFLSEQITLFRETYPKLKEKFDDTGSHLMAWCSQTFNIKPVKINTWIKTSQNEAFHGMGGMLGQTLSTINTVLIVTFLLPVYLFMILFYKSLLLEFIRRIFNSAYHTTVFEVLTNSKVIIQSYLMGLLVEAAIIAILNSVGLLLLGIDYAIILGITGALLNVIPYIGGIIAIALPMVIAFVTKDSSSYVLFVFLVYIFIQFIDNHYIIPNIVASRVKLNALISLVVVFIGAALWGIPGMFLSIPLTAIVKVICDHIQSLKAWGFLLGNSIPTKKVREGR